MVTIVTLKLEVNEQLGSSTPEVSWAISLTGRTASWRARLERGSKGGDQRDRQLCQGLCRLWPAEGVLHWNLPEPRHPWGLGLHDQVEREGFRGGWQEPGHKQHRGVSEFLLRQHFMSSFKSWNWGVENMFCRTGTECMRRLIRCWTTSPLDTDR